MKFSIKELMSICESVYKMGYNNVPFETITEEVEKLFFVNNDKTEKKIEVGFDLFSKEEIMNLKPMTYMEHSRLGPFVILMAANRKTALFPIGSDIINVFLDEDANGVLNEPMKFCTKEQFDKLRNSKQDVVKSTKKEEDEI